VPDDRKDEFGVGDVWCWVAIDAESKLVPSWLLDERKTADCVAFLDDLRGWLRYRIQLSTDAHASYKGAVGLVFAGDIDWAQVVKEYQSTNIAPGRYSPPACTGVRVKPQLGSPDLAKASTSYIERQNLTMRRFTRLTNAFSKKLESHAAAVALHFMHYNFARPHKTLANPYPRTPAMAAGSRITSGRRARSSRCSTRRPPSEASALAVGRETPEVLRELLRDQPALPEIVHQPAGLHAQTCREAKDAPQPRLTSAALEPADGRGVDVCPARELVLGDTALGSQFAQPMPERGRLATHRVHPASPPGARPPRSPQDDGSTRRRGASKGYPSGCGELLARSVANPVLVQKRLDDRGPPTP
jgi:IS1 family transposase